MALGGLVVLILHRKASRHLALTREPGTLAAAIALGGASDMSHLLRGKDTEEEMRAMLADLQFTIDPVCAIVIVVGCSFTAYMLIAFSFGIDNWPLSRSRRRGWVFRVPKALCAQIWTAPGSSHDARPASRLWA